MTDIIAYIDGLNEIELVESMAERHDLEWMALAEAEESRLQETIQ